MRISLGGVEPVRPGVCPPPGHIQFTETYRPLGRGGFSKGMPCPDPPQGVAAGGVVAMNSEYFDGSWYISPHKLRNTFVHELLHTLGLDHTNTDLDEDGVVEAYECVTDAGGRRPVMCSRTAATGGRRRRAHPIRPRRHQGAARQRAQPERRLSRPAACRYDPRATSGWCSRRKETRAGFTVPGLCSAG